MRGFFKLFQTLALLGTFLFILNLSAAEPTSAKEKLFFWKVTSPTATVYLLGSIHVGRASWYPLDTTIETAFDRSDDVTFEIDVERRALQIMALMQMHGIYPHGDSLDKHVSPETLEQLNAYLNENKLELPQVSQMKPWYISLFLPILVEQKKGLQSEHGIDYYFSLKAKRVRKPIGELEQVMDQIGTMFKLSDEVQEKMLQEMFEDQDDPNTDVDALHEKWSTGDTAVFTELYTRMMDECKDDPQMKEFALNFVDRRNHRMMKTVETYLKGKRTHFVVAGSLHMVGPDGLVELCKKAGYQVEQLVAGGRNQTTDDNGGATEKVKTAPQPKREIVNPSETDPLAQEEPATVSP